MVKKPAKTAAEKDGSTVEPATASQQAQDYALNVWAGQSPNLSRDERLARVIKALEAQGLSTAGIGSALPPHDPPTVTESPPAKRSAEAVGKYVPRPPRMTGDGTRILVMLPAAFVDVDTLAECIARAKTGIEGEPAKDSAEEFHLHFNILAARDGVEKLYKDGGLDARLRSTYERARCGMPNAEYVLFCLEDLQESQALGKDRLSFGLAVEPRQIVATPSGGVCSMTQSEIDAQQAEIQQRQAAGQFTIWEVCEILAAQRGVGVEQMRRDLVQAIMAKKLPVHIPGTERTRELHELREVVRLWDDLLFAHEVNELLEKKWGASYRFKPATAQRAASEVQGAPCDATEAQSAEGAARTPIPSIARVGGAKSPYKKAALIKLLLASWPTIEQDFRDGKANGLIDCARVPNLHGHYFKEDALAWAESKGKLEARRAATASVTLEKAWLPSAGGTEGG